MRDAAALAMRLRAVRAAALASPVRGVGVALGALAVALAALVARGGTDTRRWLGLATLVVLVAVSV